MKPDDLADVLVTTIKRALTGPLVAGRLDALEQQLAELKARLAALEAAQPAPGVEYAGTHETDKAYSSGVLVTKRGGLWLSLRDTTQTPGMDPMNWRLVVKSGQAGDAR